MRDKKIYIALFIILGVFFVIMFFAFGYKNVEQSTYETTILVGDNTVWSQSNKKWYNFTNNFSQDEYNWKKYSVFLENEKKGDYYLWHDDKWYAFDDDKNAVNLEGDFLAYRANHDISLYKFIEEEITDRTFIDKVLDDNDLSISSQFTSSFLTRVDFDNDGVEEEFYLISNAFPNDFNPDTIFSIVFMVKNSEIYYIYNDISANRSFNGCKPYFTSFLDIDNDNKYEFILSCGRYSTSETINMLYKYKEDAFKILISNQ